MFGFGGADDLFGGGGNDFLTGGLGADHLDGGEGIDTARYDDSTAGVLVSLATGRGFGGTAEGDVLVSIEDLVGSAHGDILIGTGEATAATMSTAAAAGTRCSDRTAPITSSAAAATIFCRAVLAPTSSTAGPTTTWPITATLP
jgi:hypothetical protein